MINDTFNSKFKVKHKGKYLIEEKPTEDTPVALQKVGRSKAGGFYFEFADIPYSGKSKRYDTGLDANSKEFMGKDKAEIDKVLEERKVLANHLKYLVEQHPEKNETKVIADMRNNRKIQHNMLIDTADLDNYLFLYLAMRGNKITPVNDKGNLARYGTSMYQISDAYAKKDYEEELAKKKFEARKWLMNKLSENREEALAYLRYEDFIGVKQDKKSDALIMDMFEKAIEKDYEKLTGFLHTIHRTPAEDVLQHNVLRGLYIKGVIKKERANYIFDGVDLGANVKAAVAFLKKPENSEIAERIFNKAE